MNSTETSFIEKLGGFPGKDNSPEQITKPNFLSAKIKWILDLV